jgi:uncharacterized membrane protein YgcG
MGSNMTRNALVTCILLACSGCLQHQLNTKSLKLTTSSNDLFYGQVLDNIALINDDPTALPYFDTPATGTVQLQQSVSLGYTGTWNIMGDVSKAAIAAMPTALGMNALALTPSQADSETWQLNPLADPDRLYLMHCAYRTVLGTATPECDTVLGEYYSARDAWVEISIDQNNFAMKQNQILHRMWDNAEKIDSRHQTSTDPRAELNYLRQYYTFFSPPMATVVSPQGSTTGPTIIAPGGAPSTSSSGSPSAASQSGGGGGGGGGGGASGGKPPLPIHIPYRTFLQPGWFAIGGKHDVPKDACYVGHHGSTYVWVTRDRVDGLAKFTLAILDFYNIGNSGASVPSTPPQTLR